MLPCTYHFQVLCSENFIVSQAENVISPRNINTIFEELPALFTRGVESRTN